MIVIGDCRFVMTQCHEVASRVSLRLFRSVDWFLPDILHLGSVQMSIQLAEIAGLVRSDQHADLENFVTPLLIKYTYA